MRLAPRTTSPSADMMLVPPPRVCREESRSDSSGTTSGWTKEDLRAAANANAKRPKPRRPLGAYNLFVKQEKFNMGRSGGASADGRGGRADTANALLDMIIANKGRLETTADAAAAWRGGRPGEGRQKPQPPRQSQRGGGDPNGNSNGNVKATFSNLARTISKKWKALDESSRSVFEALALLEKKRYDREVEIWYKERDAEAERTEKLTGVRLDRGCGGILDDAKASVKPGSCSSTPFTKTRLEKDSTKVRWKGSTILATRTQEQRQQESKNPSKSITDSSSPSLLTPTPARTAVRTMLPHMLRYGIPSSVFANAVSQQRSCTKSLSRSKKTSTKVDDVKCRPVPPGLAPAPRVASGQNKSCRVKTLKSQVNIAKKIRSDTEKQLPCEPKEFKNLGVSSPTPLTESDHPVKKSLPHMQYSVPPRDFNTAVRRRMSPPNVSMACCAGATSHVSEQPRRKQPLSSLTDIDFLVVSPLSATSNVASKSPQGKCPKTEEREMGKPTICLENTSSLSPGPSQVKEMTHGENRGGMQLRKGQELTPALPSKVLEIAGRQQNCGKLPELKAFLRPETCAKSKQSNASSLGEKCLLRELNLQADDKPAPLSQASSLARTDSCIGGDDLVSRQTGSAGSKHPRGNDVSTEERDRKRCRLLMKMSAGLRGGRSGVVNVSSSFQTKTLAGDHSKQLKLEKQCGNSPSEVPSSVESKVMSNLFEPNRFRYGSPTSTLPHTISADFDVSKKLTFPSMIQEHGGDLPLSRCVKEDQDEELLRVEAAQLEQEDQLLLRCTDCQGIVSSMQCGHNNAKPVQQRLSGPFEADSATGSSSLALPAIMHEIPGIISNARHIGCNFQGDDAPSGFQQGLCSADNAPTLQMAHRSSLRKDDICVPLVNSLHNTSYEPISIAGGQNARFQQTGNCILNADAGQFHDDIMKQNATLEPCSDISSMISQVFNAQSLQASSPTEEPDQCSTSNQWVHPQQSITEDLSPTLFEAHKNGSFFSCDMAAQEQWSQCPGPSILSPQAQVLHRDQLKNKSLMKTLSNESIAFLISAFK